jgi:hypothetical protein
LKKHALHIILLLPLFLSAQITSPVIRANFGLDADVRSNFFNLLLSPGNDDWFGNGASGSGIHVIDTTGAAAIVNAYTTNPASKGYAFARGMRYPVLSTIGGRILYDASYVRDYRGTDTTSFAGGNKNAQSPQLWATAISPVLSKNDITEVYLHVRRDGTNPTDSLWFFGAVGVLGTNGDRYFDFELYQTDISFNGTTRKFENYGPDFGHTTWKFDASGNITQLGDIIFTAEYGNSGLNFIEARVWVKKTDLTTVSPGAFDWTGTFDGDGTNATHGYAGIIPNNGGTFYQGLQNTVSTWSGPFGNFNTGNVHVSNYDAIQFMEFGVNLSKLGLDPMTFTNGSMCNLAFGKVLTKTRTSTSFTSTISDFVSPFRFRSVANVETMSDFPVQCPTHTVSTLNVLNPLSTSTYHWSTPNGNIVGSSTGTSVTVDRIGTYIVTQELLSGCGENGRDTVVITAVDDCSILSSSIKSFTVQLQNTSPRLSWQILNHEQTAHVTVERRTERSGFNSIATINDTNAADHHYTDNNASQDDLYFYRLKITDKDGRIYYSEVVTVKTGNSNKLQLKVNPNPVTGGSMNLYITSPKNELAGVQLIHSSGKIIEQQQHQLTKGTHHLKLNRKTLWQPGIYILRIKAGTEIVQQKIIISE